MLIKLALALTLAVPMMALAATPQPRNAKEALLTYKWQWDGPAKGNQHGIVTFAASGAVIRPWEQKAEMNWKVDESDPQKFSVTSTGKKNLTKVFSFDAQFTRFQGEAGRAEDIVGTRSTYIGTNPSPTPAPAGYADLPEYAGMALGTKWLPTSMSERKELMLSLEFYCKAAAKTAKSGKPMKPKTLWGSITWLMPVDEAIKELPARASKTTERRFTGQCFPEASMSMISFQYQNFEDAGQVFTQLVLILDAKRRVVGVELKDPSANNVFWARPGADGVREPYYNLITLTANGSSHNEVQYQIRNAGPGVTLIKTALYDRNKRRYLENVHWYLAAPFAQCVLDVAKHHREAGRL